MNRLRAIVCSNGHAPTDMVRDMNYDAYFCLICHNTTTSVSIFNKWGGLFRARRAD